MKFHGADGCVAVCPFLHLDGSDVFGKAVGKHETYVQTFI